jgi:uncharacterized membrane protein YdbT with pleckstrin-like domain
LELELLGYLPAMDTAFSAVFPVIERRAAVPRQAAQELVQIECRQHWGILIVPFLFLAGWLAMGAGFASIITSTFSIFGQSELTSAPGLIWKMFAASSLLIGVLYFHSYTRSTIRLTNRKVIVKTGPLMSGAGDIELASAHTVTMREPLLGRFLNYGTVVIVGAEGSRLRLRFVPNPRAFCEQLKGLIGASAT